MATGRRVEVNGVALHVEDTGGNGPPVLFSHGLFLDARTWDGQVEALRPRFRCIAYDHRGQGRSGTAPGGSIGLATCTADAAALIEALGVGPCHFVGLSMGGFVGMRLAAERPALLRSLALVETAADREPAWKRPQYRAMALVARWLGTGALAGRLMPVLFGQSFLRDPARAAEVARWRAHLAGSRRDLWRAARGAVVEREGLEDRLPRIALPTLVVVGEEDVATPPARAERLAAGIPGARLVRIPRAGHTAPVEAPGAVTAALADFLEAIEARPAAGAR